MAASLAAALSGGGAKGGAHVGALYALNQLGIEVSAVSGTSAGAVVAGLLACGYTPADLIEILEDFAKKGKKFIDPYYGGFVRGILFGSPVDGLLKADRLYRYLKGLCGARTLSQAVLPLVITAVDIQSGRLIFFTSHPQETLRKLNLAHDEVIGDLTIVDAIRASIAIPGVFRPYYLGERILVDGGVLDPLPANALYALGAGRVLGVNLGYAGQLRGDVDNLAEIVSQSISLMGYELSKARSFLADVVVNVDAGIGTLAFDQVHKAAKEGYLEVMRQKAAILSLANQASIGIKNTPASKLRGLKLRSG